MVNILIAGDFAPNQRVASIIESGNSNEIFSEVLPYTNISDYAILNLECPVIDIKSVKPIKKHGPSLSCSGLSVQAVKDAGFDCVTLANNHLYDYGDYGVVTTLKKCSDVGLDVVGGGLNIDYARTILYKTIENIRFAFINCCEEEFSIATKSTAGANPLNPIQQYYDIKKAKEIVDFVVVIVHGGPEGYQLPTPEMKEVYRFMIDAGASVVVNHHQHCYSGYEIYNGGHIFYGLGNFSFDEKESSGALWNEGYMLMLNFERELKFDIIPYVQGGKTPGIVLMKDDMRECFIKNINILNNIISIDSELNRYYENFVESTSCEYIMALEPYHNRYLCAARRRSLIPSFITEKRLHKVMDYIQCQSHLSRFKKVLRKKYRIM